MVTEQLTDQMRADGRALTKALDYADLRLSSAFWYYFEEANQWRYVFVSPLVDETGPKEVYKRVQKVLSQKNTVLTTVGLTNIVAVPAELPLAQFLGFVTRNSEAPNAHFDVDERFINNAYVYRVTR